MTSLFSTRKLALVAVSVVVLYVCLRQAQHRNNAADRSQVSLRAKVEEIDRPTRDCERSPYDPYRISGIPVQSFKPEVAVWENSCITLKFSKSVKFPHTALASHPGSGSTWSRHLIQQVTGIYIGSVYGDLLVSSEHQPTSFSRWSDLVWNGSCVAIKTHEGFAGQPPFRPEKYDKAIVVIRNPHHSMLAEFKRRHWNVAQNVLNEEDIFSSNHFEQFFPGEAKSWLNFHKQWLTADLCILVLQYEQLQSDLHLQLLRVAHFLGIDTDRLDPNHLKCIVGNTGGKLKWPRAHAPASPFTSAMNTTLETYKTEIRELLRSRHGINNVSF